MFPETESSSPGYYQELTMAGGRLHCPLRPLRPPGREMSAMPTMTVADLLASLRSLHVLDAAQLEKLSALQARIPEPQALLKKLVEQRWLTAYQAKQLYQGRGKELLLDSYVIIDRLGEGGMGEVFK